MTQWLFRVITSLWCCKWFFVFRIIKGCCCFGISCWFVLCHGLSRDGRLTGCTFYRRYRDFIVFAVWSRGILLCVIFAFCSGQAWEAGIPWIDRPRWTQGQTLQSHVHRRTTVILNWTFPPWFPFMIMYHLNMCKLDVNTPLPQGNGPPSTFGLIWTKNERHE